MPNLCFVFGAWNNLLETLQGLVDERRSSIGQMPAMPQISPAADDNRRSL
jgi:hypothetical protein